MWESTQMKGIQEWNDCWGLSGGDPVKAQKQLWAEISPSKVGWGQGSLDAAPQAGWKFREVFLLTHGSHFSLQPACGSPFSSSCQQELCLPLAPVTMWPSLQPQQDLSLTFLLSLSLCLSQIPITLGTKKRYCQFEKPHYKITFSIWWKKSTIETQFKPQQHWRDPFLRMNIPTNNHSAHIKGQNWWE